MISKLLGPQRATDGRRGIPQGHRGTTKDIAGISWDAYDLALSCVRLVLVNYKIVNICKFIVSAFCTKTRLFNLKRNYERILSALLSFVVITDIALK